VAVIVAAMSGSADLGGLRAVQTLLGPAQLLAQSGDAVALPAASRRHAQKGRTAGVAFSMRYGALLMAALGAYGLLLVMFRGQILHTVLGPRFDGYARLVIPLSLGLVATAWSFGAATGLRARRDGRAMARGEAIGAALRIACVGVLVATSGVVGAAWGVAISSLLYAGAMWGVFLRGGRNA